MVRAQSRIHTAQKTHMARYIIEGNERVARLVESTMRVIVKIDTRVALLEYAKRHDIKLTEGNVE